MAVEITMPSRKAGRPCKELSSGYSYGTGYCEKSQGTASTKRWSQHHKGRTVDQRGYGSQSRIIRKQVLPRDKNLCQACLRNNVATPAKQVII
jgi:5-methylcytosine-specific restriction protein A